MALDNAFFSTSGNDTTGNGSQGNPYRTPKKACDNVNPNGTVFGRGGTYNVWALDSPGSGTATFLNLPSGTGGSFTTVKNFDSEPVVFQAQNSSAHQVVYFPTSKEFMKLEGIEVDGNQYVNHCIRSTAVADVEIVGCEVWNGSIGYLKSGYGHRVNIRTSVFHTTVDTVSGTPKSHAIYYGAGGNSDDCIIENNRIYNIGKNAVQIQPNDGSVFNRFIVSGNTISDWNTKLAGSPGSIGSGIYLQAGLNSKIINNIMMRESLLGETWVGAINLRGSVSGTLVAHNIIHQVRLCGVYITDGFSAGAITVHNNIILEFDEASLGSAAIQHTNQTVSNNIITGSIGTHVVDGSNANVNLRDYHLLSTSSARDGGVAVGVEFDKDGVIRTQGSAPDIGPYEYLEAGLWLASSQNPTGSWLDSSFDDRCFRILLDGASITASATALRVVVRGRNSGSYTLNRMTLAERDGATLNVDDTTFTEVTFGGTWDAGVTVSEGTTVRSDVITFDTTPGTDLFCTFWLASGQPACYFSNGAETQAWILTGNDQTATEDWGALTVDETRSLIYVVARLDEDVSPVTPSAPQVNTASFTVVPGELKTLTGVSVSDQDDDIEEVTALATQSSICFTNPDDTDIVFTHYTGA